jgi:hypothetical protein
LHPPRASASHSNSGLPRPSENNTSTNEAPTSSPISSLTRIPIPHPLDSSASPEVPLFPFSRQGSRVAPSPIHTTDSPRKAIPPWEQTPSNFSSDTRFALPRLPPPSSTTPSWNPSDHKIVAPGSPVIVPGASPEPPQSDPLGVRVLR